MHPSTPSPIRHADSSIRWQPDNIHTIQDALAYISHPQHVQLNIPTQPVAVEATQIVSIESLPPILVLHIKRFEYDVKVGGVVKIGKQVRFEDELAIGGGESLPFPNVHRMRY